MVDALRNNCLAYAHIPEEYDTVKVAATAAAAAPATDADSVNGLITPKNLNLSIQNFFNAIGLEFTRYSSIKETGDSIKWEDLLYWLKTSSIISKDEIEKLSLLLKNKDYNEFFKNIPRFLKYSQNMFSDYYILDGNIYISEDDFDFYFGAYAAGRTPASQDVSLPLDKSKFI